MCKYLFILPLFQRKCILSLYIYSFFKITLNGKSHHRFRCSFIPWSWKTLFFSFYIFIFLSDSWRKVKNKIIRKLFVKNKNNNKRFKDAKVEEIYFRVEHKHSTSTTERKRREAVWWKCVRSERSQIRHIIFKTLVSIGIFSHDFDVFMAIYFIQVYFFSGVFEWRKMTTFLLLLKIHFILDEFPYDFSHRRVLLAVWENSFAIIIMLNLLYVFYANGILYADEKD